MINLLIPAVSNIISNVVDKSIEDKNAANKLKEQLLPHVAELSKKELTAARDTIVAEAKSESMLARNWRPITMLVFVFIIANNYIFYPYLALFWDNAPVLAIPDDMWDLLKIGLGGYVVGRSTEKGIKAWKTNE